jgi:hypothetical protein
VGQQGAGLGVADAVLVSEYRQVDSPNE